MEWLFYLASTLFVVLGLGSLVLTAIGLPGNWILVGLAVVVELTDHLYMGVPTETYGWWVIGGCALGVVGGELIETLTGAAGTKVAGGTRRGMTGAVIGGIVGAIVLTPLIPVPIVGTLIGALLGTFTGALIAERSHKDRDPEQSIGKDLKAATGATLGRLVGTIAKTVIGVVIWIVLLAVMFWPT